MSFRMNHPASKFYMLALAALFAVVVSGCSSSSSKDPVAMAPPTTTDPETPVGPTAEQIAATATALTAYTTAKTAHTTAMTVYDGDMSVANANALKTAADDLHAAAMAARTAVDAGATDDQKAALGDTAVADATAAVTAADTAVMTEQAAVAAAAVVAATEAAKTKTTEIAMEAAQADDAGLGGSGVDTVTMTIARDADSTTVTIADTGLAGDDDPKFAQAMDLGSGRTMHVRTMEADADGNVVEEVVVVSTDIEAPKATKFTTVYMLDANPNDATPPVNQSLDIDSGNLAMIMTDGITATGAGQITVLAAVEDNDQTANVDETVAAFETAATFDGAPGTLKCAGDANCTVTLDADGDITDFGNGWEFTPADGATVDVADDDYLHYGFWLKRTTDEDGVLTYNEVETFAGSSVAPSGDVTSVTGSATYNGGATGVYVRNVYKAEDGSVDTATSGHFAADAMLKATFGQVNDADNEGTIAPNLLDTLTGSISNFELSGGESNEWSAKLTGEINTSDGTASGAANGGGDAGTFTATFHGPTTDADNDPIQPNSVVGEFGANFSNGSVAGAFGARKQ